ncbi:MAG: hypothetical protein J6Y02_02535 [Pseudobutyrivibrio sp.]|nr:hypothetical protein [Pseudobutyrivibrio sp.]
MNEFFRLFDSFKGRNPLLAVQLISAPNKSTYTLEVRNAGDVVFTTAGTDLELMFALGKSKLMLHKKELV